MERIKLKDNKIILVDNDDFGWLSGFKWRCVKSSKTFYAQKYQSPDSTITMHRLIMSPPKGYVVDHINRNGLDNRRSNLRICTISQNKMNMLPRADNKSGYKGVDYVPRDGIWRATIKFKGQNKINLGSFRTPQEAALAYNEAAKRYFGEFAYFNILKTVGHD